jgi:hypothetical protein
MSPRVLKLIVLGYVVKTLLLGLAWLMVPDLPARAASKARQAWTAVAGGTAERAARP